MTILTPTQIRQIADKYIDVWANAEPMTQTLREHVADAIAEALEMQSREYQSGANTLRHERDRAIEELNALRMQVEVGH
jgi:hypothetical protein